MSQRTEKRPFLAAALSFLQPGLGHLYLREWFRTSLWAVLWIGSLGLVVDAAEVDLTAVEALAAAVGVFALVEGVPTGATVSLVAVAAFGAVDAYWLAVKNNRRVADDVERCPHCGKDLDPALEFCHWCTTPLESEESA